MMLRIALASMACVAVLVVPALAEEETKPKNDNGASGSGWSAEVAPENGTGLVLDERQTQIVKEVDAYFNDLGDLKGQFLQVSEGKRPMRGRFMIKRPGKFRFDYNRPSRQIIISDGTYLAIQDLDLNNEDRVELDQTPFRLLVRKKVDLLQDALITGVEETDDKFILGLRDKDPDTPGQIKLEFTRKPKLELTEWVTKDAQGVDTRVSVGELVKDEKIDAGVFKIKPVGLMQHP